MADKQTILDNVTQYSAKELFEFILQGKVSFDELVHETEGQFDPQKRREVKQLLTEMGDLDEVMYKKVTDERTVEICDRYLQQFSDGKFSNEVKAIKVQLETDAKAAEAWNRVDKEDETLLKEFINDFPDSSFASEARRIVNELSGGRITRFTREVFVDTIHNYQSQKMSDEGIADWIRKDVIESGKLGKDALLESLKEDHNLLHAPTVKILTDHFVITVGDLQSIGIEDVYIKKMYDGEKPLFFEATFEKFEKVSKPATEIYFWGIPSSGKSCALGAILSVASNGTVAKIMFPDSESQGYGYMFQLMNLFRDGEVGCLMGGTAIDEFYEMGFDLVDEGGRTHPITCIDMAGELMRCLWKKNAKAFLDVSEKAMLDTLHSILIDSKSNNRKIHFFVVEYGAENKTYEGLKQDAFLSGAMTYLIDTGVFKKNTDAIYILITKADKAKERSKEAMRNYIMRKYGGFYNALNQICEKNDINNGEVGMVAFTLGDVCFQDFCKFDSRPAENMVQVILDRTAGFKDSKLERFKNRFKG